MVFEVRGKPAEIIRPKDSQDLNLDEVQSPEQQTITLACDTLTEHETHTVQLSASPVAAESLFSPTQEAAAQSRAAASLSSPTAEAAQSLAAAVRIFRAASSIERSTR